MRISLALAALLTTPVLLLTACNGGHTYVKPLRGTVVEKEYEPAKMKKVPITRRICATTKPKPTRATPKPRLQRTCTSAATGRFTTVVVKKACYELDIRLPSGKETEVCDKYAFYALIPGDTYSSSTDYHKKVRR